MSRCPVQSYSLLCKVDAKQAESRPVAVSGVEDGGDLAAIVICQQRQPRQPQNRPHTHRARRRRRIVAEAVPISWLLGSSRGSDRLAARVSSPLGSARGTDRLRFGSVRGSDRGSWLRLVARIGSRLKLARGSDRLVARDGFCRMNCCLSVEQQHSPSTVHPAGSGVSGTG